MREAPSRALIDGLLGARRARSRAYDPVAMRRGAAHLRRRDARSRIVEHADGGAARAPMRSSIVTEWKEFRSPDFDAHQDAR